MTNIISYATPQQLTQNLKKVYRRGWILRGIALGHCETVYDHTIDMKQTGKLTARIFDFNETQFVDELECHDWHEQIKLVGDITPHDNISKEEKLQKEFAGIRILLSQMEPQQANYYMNLWQNYTKQLTFQDKIGHMLDKIAPFILTPRYTYLRYNVSEFKPYARERVEDPTLLGIFDQFTEEMEDYLRYLLPKKGSKDKTILTKVLRPHNHYFELLQQTAQQTRGNI